MDYLILTHSLSTIYTRLLLYVSTYILVGIKEIFSLIHIFHILYCYYNDYLNLYL